MRVIILLSTLFLAACGESSDDAARIVIGESKVLTTPNNLQYQMGFVVQVTDTDGNPAGATSVSISFKSLTYFKGQYIGIDTDTDGLSDAWSISSTPCAAEDTNNNGVLDGGEDINASGSLEPTNPGTIAAHATETPTIQAGSNKIITDESGFGYFALTYPVAQANWVDVVVTAKASVSGTENNESKNFSLVTAVGDVTFPSLPPGGIASPYGTVLDCNSAL